MLCPRGFCLRSGPSGRVSCSNGVRNVMAVDGFANGPASASGFIAAGYSSRVCSEDDCGICSWLVPNGVPTPALAKRCSNCENHLFHWKEPGLVNK